MLRRIRIHEGQLLLDLQDLDLRVVGKTLLSVGSLLPWFHPAGGEPMGTADHRDVPLVAGEAPYTFKGTTDVMRGHIRPDGEGGCLH